MATRSVSPGGALLRASRVFAIPPPLPRPAGNLSSSAIYSSDSATLPHPVRLAITTPQASLARGDWGFKRPLPLRSTTKTSTPHIRVEAIDTYEHITEFGSAADHTITLRKWQEMGVPLTVAVVDDPTKTGSFKSEKRRSVFEDDIDYTTGPKAGDPKEDIRWKFKGPYLPAQTEGDFTEYISTQVRKRKNEFQEFLRTACATDLNQQARLASTEEMPPAILGDDVTQAQLTVFIKNLRNDRAALFGHIRTFLDLPPVAPPHERILESTLADMEHGFKEKITSNQFAVSLSPYAVSGPPKTHPSAGLSYSRSSAHIFNHPQFGPQKYSPPVMGRVVRPKGASAGSFAPVLGVGGFVVDVPSGSAPSFNLGKSSRSAPQAQIPGLLQIEPNKVGGSKAYLQPTHARVNPKGQVILEVKIGDPDAIAVLENTTDQIPKPRTGPTSLGGPSRSTGYSTSSTSRSNRGYGVGDEDFSRNREPFARRGGDALKSLQDVIGGL